MKTKGESFIIDSRLLSVSKYTSGLPCKKLVNVYHDAFFPAGGNRDYDAVAWDYPSERGGDSVLCGMPVR